MTTALLVLLILVGAPICMAILGVPGFVGRLRDRLLPATGADRLRASLEENDELYRFARKSFEKASQTGRSGASLDPAAAAEIAALNLYVERTQIQLRGRALWCGLGAAFCLLLDAAVAAAALLTLTVTAVPAEAAWPAVALWALRSAILAALSFGLVYAVTLVGRDLFAAAAAALEKRHSLGFGRLYVQMKVLAAPDARRAARALTETELLRAFGWNPPAPPPSPAADEAPIRALSLPPHSLTPVRTIGPVRNGEAPEPPPS
jgi:hypothetical protein